MRNLKKCINVQQNKQKNKTIKRVEQLHRKKRCLFYSLTYFS